MHKRSEKEDAFVVAVGAEIARRRVERGWSQAELGRRMGIKPVTLSQYERGVHAIALYCLLRMAMVLRVSFADLVRPAVEKVAALRKGQLTEQ